MWQNVILWICIALNWVCIALNIWGINRSVKAARVANDQADRLYYERMRVVFARLTPPEE